MKLKKIPPALILLVTAPVFGELFSASSPFNEFINPVTFITLALLYGCGAIIVRELLVRWRKGWLSLLLLGCAYGIYEEGLLVQSSDHKAGRYAVNINAVPGKLKGEVFRETDYCRLACGVG